MTRLSAGSAVHATGIANSRNTRRGLVPLATTRMVHKVARTGSPMPVRVAAPSRWRAPTPVTNTAMPSCAASTWASVARSTASGAG